jgi:hypothetical protein
MTFEVSESIYCLPQENPGNFIIFIHEKISSLWVFLSFLIHFKMQNFDSLKQEFQRFGYALLPSSGKSWKIYIFYSWKKRLFMSFLEPSKILNATHN